ncbi:MAG: hypothetical protein SF029_24405 [bacterium]|nr:hypothetical protein [bacterium]
MKKWSLLLVGVLMLALVGSVSAQGTTFSDEELEAIEFVSEAVDTFLALESYTAEGENVLAQDISIAGTTITQELVQELAGDYAIDEDGMVSAAVTINQTIDQVGAGMNISGGMVMEIVVAEETLYARVSDTTGAMAGMFPDGWVNVNENPNAIAGMSAINTDQYVNLFSSQVGYPVNEDSIDAITELDSVEGEDGQELRVFVVEYNVDYLDESGALDQALGAFDFTQFGLSQEDADALIESFLDGMELKTTMRIGADDGLIYGLDSDMQVEAEFSGAITQGQTMTIAQTVTYAIRFSGFNEPVEIDVPDVN